MRIGFNPNKDKIKEPDEYFHQVIIPVYIPNEEGYFKDSFQILKYCLESLLKTSHANTYFTIVNNGSCKKVVTYLNGLFEGKMIHEVIHTTNIGKLNAILKGINGQKFTLITISDADVLFLNNWQKATYEVFNNFSKAGFISTTPNPKMIRYYTSNIIFEKWLSKKLKFTDVVNTQAMKDFANSVGNSKLFRKIHLDKNLTIFSNKVRAVIGSGHFVGTYRGELFHNLRKNESNYNLGGDSEILFLDAPVVKKGYWRLATENNYTYHMGNTIEDWMLNVLENQIKEKTVLFQPSLVNNKSFLIVNYFKTVVFSKILYNKKVWYLFLRWKGLSKENSKIY